MKMYVVGLAFFGISFSTPALSGGMATPLMEPEVIAEESVGSSGSSIIPLLLLLLIAVAASGSGSSGGPTF